MDRALERIQQNVADISLFGLVIYGVPYATRSCDSRYSPIAGVAPGPAGHVCVGRAVAAAGSWEPED
jgi:hypothetical protein